MCYKVLAIVVNFIGLLDLVVSVIIDLLLIWNLVWIYGLFIMSYEVGCIWKKVLIGVGGILLS